MRRVGRAADDGYRSDLAPGLRATVEAERLAEELAFAAARLAELATDPPGPLAEVATADFEEAAWLAFLVAYLAPVEGEDPWAGIEAARVPWATGELPELDGVPTGPRSAHDPARGHATVLAYRAWARRAGSQRAALEGEAGWAPERRFERAFERLGGLQGLHRAARYDLLLILGRTGRLDVRPDSLFLAVADDPATIAAKQVFGIGDRFLLDRRAAALAQAAGVPLEALDLALVNWGRAPGDRATAGARPAGVDGSARERVAAALGV